ncbi:MAG: threonine synthase [Succinivibrio sp.]|nr:threonine synthase [Succinivibrio sp.]
MKLYNLKDDSEQVSFAQAVVQGIGRGQGLFFPHAIEPLENIEELLRLPLVPRSQRILRHLIGDEIPQLESLIEDAFNFPCPLVKAAENVYALELFHGPTLAFKDFGARFMARVLGAVKGERHVTVLTATSGDTGAAVAAAFKDQPNIDVVVLYPQGKISPLQAKLINTLGGNIHAVEIAGIFDQCQDLVKQAFDDTAFRNQVGLNSANSINISRLLAQVSYYFEAVAQLPEHSRDRVIFSVPCGNFGNITAGLIAKTLGLKARFVIACNVNDTVPRYLKSGSWEPHQTVATLSNAMDISRPNNWPRVEALCRMNKWPWSDFACNSMTDEETARTMVQLYKQSGYVLEPHAAIAYQSLSNVLKEGETGIFLGTAHPAKFKQDVDRILGIDLPLPDALAQAVKKDSEVVRLEVNYAALTDYILKTVGQ